jgi:hypothetical protein
VKFTAVSRKFLEINELEENREVENIAESMT